MYFAELFMKYREEVNPSAQVFLVSFLRGNEVGGVNRSLLASGITAKQFRMNLANPDLSKLHLLLGEVRCEAVRLSTRGVTAGDMGKVNVSHLKDKGKLVTAKVLAIEGEDEVRICITVPRAMVERYREERGDQKAVRDLCGSGCLNSSNPGNILHDPKCDEWQLHPERHFPSLQDANPTTLPLDPSLDPSLMHLPS